jgi:prepilin-type N-terminal cleavage/methylation domain-containing protein
MKKLGYKGFTLIELLIVIVIIGILAGVVLQILDPARQQNRARDGVTRSNMNKLSLVFGSYNAAYGNYPPETTGLANEIESLAGGVSCGAGVCTFELDTSSAVTYTYNLNAGGFELYANALALPNICNPGASSACTHFRLDQTGTFQACTNASGSGCVSLPN